MAYEKVTVSAMTDTSAPRRRLPTGATLSIWTAADGWPLRRFDWPGGDRGRLLFQTGRGDMVEKYYEAIAHLHAQGWSVTAFDWRGQGGSGRLSADRRVGHAEDFALFVGDLAGFWRDWRGSDPRPHVVLGHSMGGHLVLRALVERAIDAEAAILVAPMLGLGGPFGPRIGGRIARFMMRRGDPARAAWKAGERPGGIASRQALLTHDADRYADELYWHAVDDTLASGPPSWSWMAQAFASTAALGVDPRVQSLATPVLMLVADADRLVDPRAARRYAARLPQAELVRFGDESAHEILREHDPVRMRALAEIDRFLARVTAR